MAKKKKKSKTTKSEPSVKFLRPEPTENIAILFLPTEKFWEWMAEDEEIREDIPRMKEKGAADTCVLVYDYGDPELVADYCHSRHSHFMEALFGGWLTDPGLWPKISSFSELGAYFSMQVVPTVVELEPVEIG